MHALVTGGAGFIGSHLVEKLLAAGHQVTTVDSFDTFYDPDIKRRNLGRSMDSARFRLLVGDIRDVAFLEEQCPSDIDVIVHLAARAGVRPSLVDPALYADVNVTGTIQLLELARRRGIARFVFGSSSSVYGNDAKPPFSESESAVQPISPYAATKRAGELIASSYHHLYGLSVASLRFFTVYGPRQRPDLAIHKFAKSMLEGRPIQVFGDGSMRRDFTYVDDIIQGIEGAIDWTGTRTGFEVFNLGESETTSVTELIGLLEKALGVPATVTHCPEQPGDVRITCADIRKARQGLNYQPSVSMPEGLRRFADWLLAAR